MATGLDPDRIDAGVDLGHAEDLSIWSIGSPSDTSTGPEPATYTVEPA
jgi:hypothetical protein